MPLYPASTYTSWQLASMLAIDRIGPPCAEHDAMDREIFAELAARQIAESDVEQMIALARSIRKHISPVVCMDVDDLEFGIRSQFESGKIEAAERDRLLAFVAAHVDSPREPRRATRRARWSETLVIVYMVVGFAWVAAAQSKRGFWIWLAGMLVIVWLQQSWPSWRLRRWPVAGRGKGDTHQ
jgi:hypothetical protein